MADDGLLTDDEKTALIALLKRVVDASDDPEWMPENSDFRKRAMARLRTLGDK